MPSATENDPRIYLNPGAVTVRNRIEETLRHAADKQAEVDDINERLGNIQSIRSLQVSRVALRDMLRIQTDKLGIRTLEADTIVSSGLEIKAVDIDDNEVIAEGLLVAADYRAGTLVVMGDNGESYEFEYVSNVLAPEDSGQSYFGRKLAVGLDVTSLPKDKSWIIRQDNYL